MKSSLDRWQSHSVSDKDYLTQNNRLSLFNEVATILDHKSPSFYTNEKSYFDSNMDLNNNNNSNETTKNIKMYFLSPMTQWIL